MLLPFLYQNGIDPTNNEPLRRAAITRKVGGCNRTVAGAAAHAVLASVGATCRQRGIPVPDFLVQLQRAPVRQPPAIVNATPPLAPP